VIEILQPLGIAVAAKHAEDGLKIEVGKRLIIIHKMIRNWKCYYDIGLFSDSIFKF
jgi:hypothetical protein